MFNRVLQYLTLITSIAIASVAAYFSVIGLSTIFAGAFWSVVVMASILEVGKLVSAVWLHTYWKQIQTIVRTYLSIAVGVLMLITSMGIFGYLSKAHIETSASGADYVAQIERLENRIDREQITIDRASATLKTLDDALDKYVELGAISKGLAAREEQKEERVQLNVLMDESYAKIDEYNEKIADIRTDLRAFEVEVGPIRYVAELIYGNNTAENLGSAIRWAMIMIIFVFDPLAIILLITSTHAIKTQKKKYKSRKNFNYIDPKDIVKMESI